jgi:hypothetical protein
MMRDLHNNIEVRRLISPTRQTNDSTAVVSQVIDLVNVTKCEFVIALGSLTDADATFAVLVEDGADSALSDNAAVDDAYLIGTEAGAAFTYANDNEVRKIGYIGPKRYVRLTVTPTNNNSGNLDIAAVAILSGHRVLPKSSQSA